LHGAEHVAPDQWLALMRAGDADALAFFRARVMPPPALVARHPGLGAAYLSPRTDTLGSSLSPAERVTGAAQTFERLFGAPARGFVAPNHAWEASLEDRLASLGIRYIQAAQHWYPSWQSFAQQAWVSRHAGEIGQSGLCYQTRNIDFEPAVRPELTERAVRRALLLAERRIPIVVNTHRINYVGGIDADSAERGRTALRSMIERLLANFPDLEFATSSDLDLELRRTPRAAASRPSTRWWEFFGDAVRVTVRRDAFHDME